MKGESARLWRHALAPCRRIHVYTVDPGAHAVATALVPLIRTMGRLGAWFAEGWAAANDPGCRAAGEIETLVSPDETLLMGSQTNFARTRAVLRWAAQAGVRSIFVFDHWKNFAEHFESGPLPDMIVVPDELARRLLLAATGAEAASRVQVLPHLALEAAVERVRSWGSIGDSGTIGLLLDPTEPGDGLGYDWRSTLAAAALAARPMDKRILVKPHPRQDAYAVAQALLAWCVRGTRYEIYQGDTEHLIAMAEEIWGMTTIALNIALAAGKTVRSFQVGRTAAGERASNAHIEPYVVR